MQGSDSDLEFVVEGDVLGVVGHGGVRFANAVVRQAALKMEQTSFSGKAEKLSNRR